MAKIADPVKVLGKTHCWLVAPPKRVCQPIVCYQPPHPGHLEVVYRDDDVAVILKPAELLSVPGKDPNHYDCVEFRAKQIFDDARIVHRLDMPTSGLMVLALNASAHRHLGLQFERRHVKKQYLARVWGKLPANRGVIDLPIRCDWPNRPIQMVDYEHGRLAQTSFEVLQSDDQSTLVRLFPKTGRSHQLRLHMAELGHPILGDSFYAFGEALEASSRLNLHASKLAFFSPSNGELLEFENSNAELIFNAT